MIKRPFLLLQRIRWDVVFWLVIRSFDQSTTKRRDGFALEGDEREALSAQIICVDCYGTTVFCSRDSEILLIELFRYKCQLGAVLPGELGNWTLGCLESIRAGKRFRSRSLLIESPDVQVRVTLLAGTPRAIYALHLEEVETSKSVVSADLRKYVPCGFTPRQSETMYWLARGLKNQEIAVQMTISERTVESHVDSIFTKLGATNRRMAAYRANAMLAEIGTLRVSLPTT